MQLKTVLLLLASAALAAGQPAVQWDPLNGGTAIVTTGPELLAALDSNIGDITLANNITLVPEDWQPYQLPIKIAAVNRTVLVHGDRGSKTMVDWGYSLGLLEVQSNASLAFRDVISQHPGNRTEGVETLPQEIKGSVVWPTIGGQEGHKVFLVDTDVFMDIAKCNPDFVQVEVERFHQLLNSTELVQYKGGVSVLYVYIPFPAPIIDIVSKQQVGSGRYTMANVITNCYDSSAPTGAHTDGGTPAWVWAVVGSVLGCLALAGIAATLFFRRRRRQHAAQAAEAAAAGDESGRGLSKAGSGAELASLSMFGSQSYDKHLSGQPSGELHNQIMRTRFGPIDGVQLGELLGRGAFGRVYKGRWKGAIVAVKVIDHRVQPGKTYDLSREPLLSMSVSHPNIVTTHKMCIVKVQTGNISGGAGQQEGTPPPGASGSSASAGGGSHQKGMSGSGGKLVPAIDGGSGMVEIVSPHDVLRPGLYESWLICEHCERGSLADVIANGQLSPADPAQRNVWVVLCLLDIALGLDYLHSSTIIHGDLKPANVMLKGARNDRRGFTCKLGDFGLSRMLGNEESHVETQSFGTASYAAPELLTEGKLTKSADIFSLAIVAWELSAAAAAGAAQELHPGMTAMQVIMQVSQHQLRPEVPAGCPPQLADLMRRCWSQDPALRPTASQVVEELRGQLMALRPSSHGTLRPAAP